MKMKIPVIALAASTAILLSACNDKEDETKIDEVFSYEVNEEIPKDKLPLSDEGTTTFEVKSENEELPFYEVLGTETTIAEVAILKSSIGSGVAFDNTEVDVMALFKKVIMNAEIDASGEKPVAEPDYRIDVLAGLGETRKLNVWVKNDNRQIILTHAEKAEVVYALKGNETEELSNFFNKYFEE